MRGAFCAAVGQNGEGLTVYRQAPPAHEPGRESEISGRGGEPLQRADAVAELEKAQQQRRAACAETGSLAASSAESAGSSPQESSRPVRIEKQTTKPQTLRRLVTVWRTASESAREKGRGATDA